ncbi:MAG: NADH-quinone oxidoreductase subunit L [Desulfobacterales bacterium]
MNPTYIQNPALAAAILATGLPFAAFFLIMVFTRPYPRLSAGLSITAVTISLASAVFLLADNWRLPVPAEYVGRWLISGDITVLFGFLLDQTSLLMLVIVAAISFLVQIYSLGYMAGDVGFSRYYAFMSLFVWAMLNLSLSPTMLQLYVFWELVGLSSYLLIGFWYEKFSASEAGKKAFVMTRFGDIAFFLGILLVLVNLGDLNILAMNSAQVGAQMSSALITAAALLIFGGIIGKSAQFPLLTWLPDAMEGPTPVSALLHSATMVAAGVFLFARLFPFFSLSATAMAVFLAIGTISMLLASTMAMVSRDIKQVWAYSTISQLGFMIMGLAAGSYFAGVFHLTTHAGFKALLFLCSGVFIHAYGSNDVFEISRRGGRRLKIPTVSIVIAAAALAGLPPLSGFFSKELILGALAELKNPVWLAAGLLGAFLTAYYAFRLIFIILFPRQTPTEPKAGHAEAHPHSGYWQMAWPLVVLATATVLLGFFQGALAEFTNANPAVEAAPGGHHGWLPWVALSCAGFGVILAYAEFGRRRAKQVGFVEKIAPVNNLFAERWYIDRFYRRFLDIFIYGVVSNLLTQNDKKIIDGGIDDLSKGTVATGRLVSFLHLGMVQYKLLTIFVVMVLLGVYFFI